MSSGSAAAVGAETWASSVQDHQSGSSLSARRRHPRRQGGQVARRLGVKVYGARPVPTGVAEIRISDKRRNHSFFMGHYNQPSTARNLNYDLTPQPPYCGEKRKRLTTRRKAHQRAPNSPEYRAAPSRAGIVYSTVFALVPETDSGA